MPGKTDERDLRLTKLRELLLTGALLTQGELVLRLRAEGFSVTQSSVSRDLRELKAFKVEGAYRLPEALAMPARDSAWAMAIRTVVPAGNHLLVVQTRTGAAPQVALGIDREAWSEVLGTVAGDDTLFIAVPGFEQRRRVEQRLAALSVQE